MERERRARKSRHLHPDELHEILMEQDSDEDFEEDENMSSSSSSSENEEEEVADVAFRHRRPQDSPNVLPFTGPPSGINRAAAPNINAQSSPFSIFILFFQQIFQILMVETNRYYRQFLARQDAAGFYSSIA